MAVYLESSSGDRADAARQPRGVRPPRDQTAADERCQRPQDEHRLPRHPAVGAVLTAPFGGDALFSREGHRRSPRQRRLRHRVDRAEFGSFSYEEVAAAAPAAGSIGVLPPVRVVRPVGHRSRRRARRALRHGHCATMGRGQEQMAASASTPVSGSGSSPTMASRTWRRPSGGGIIPTGPGTSCRGHRPPHFAVDRQGILTPESAQRRSTRRRPRSGLQRRRPPGRPGPGQPRRVPTSRTPSADRFRCRPTAASAPAPTSSSPSHSARPRHLGRLAAYGPAQRAMESTHHRAPHRELRRP